MKIVKKYRISDYLVEKLSLLGLEKVFLITGGGAMHLNDAFTRNPKMKVTFMHHEQALAMAADGYARVANKPAIVNVTTGPGGINSLNGVFGAFVDSIPMVVVSGQVRTETIANLNNPLLRQLGDQEADIKNTVKACVKFFSMPKTKDEALYAIDKTIEFLKNGRPGPVWLDIPINIQSIQITKDDISSLNKKNLNNELIHYIHPNFKNENPTDLNIEKDALVLIDLIKKAKRPVFLAGTGVSIAKQNSNFVNLLHTLNIPGLTGWNAHDVLPNDHICYCGKPGSQGDRSGNFATKNADLIVVMGCRLNIRQISYNWKSFGSNAKIVMIDIDKSEIEKHTLNIDYKMHYSLESFLPILLTKVKDWKVLDDHINYLKWCQNRVKKYPVVSNHHYKKNSPINPYAFFDQLYKNSIPGDKIVVGNGSACVIGFQSAVIKENVRLFTNSGCASMGFDLPAAIGASLGCVKGKVICVAGDGSLMMNIQELATVKHLKLPIKLFILDNDGYHSIRQTQTNYFPDNIAGTGSGDGIGFPDFAEVTKAFGINSIYINNMSDLKKIFLEEYYTNNLPQAYIIKIDLSQEFEPKLRSKQLEDGSMSTPELHDMYPFLTDEEMKKNIIDV